MIGQWKPEKSAFDTIFRSGKTRGNECREDMMETAGFKSETLKY
jgi:hypothetical protein